MQLKKKEENCSKKVTIDYVNHGIFAQVEQTSLQKVNSLSRKIYRTPYLLLYKENAPYSLIENCIFSTIWNKGEFFTVRIVPNIHGTFCICQVSTFIKKIFPHIIGGDISRVFHTRLM